MNRRTDTRPAVVSERAEDAAPSVDSAIKLTVNGQRPAAVLLTQRMIGAKTFKEER